MTPFAAAAAVARQTNDESGGSSSPYHSAFGDARNPTFVGLPQQPPPVDKISTANRH